MPKRSERQEYASSFDGNPYNNVSPKAMYKRLRWGNKVVDTFNIDAPEPMVVLGELAKLRRGKTTFWSFEENNGPFLAVGRDSNLLYIISRHEDGSPCNVPSNGYKPLCVITGIDYYSDKGGEDIYYFHNHEKPYPTLMQHSKGCWYLKPSYLSDGGRSYVVDDAGIIG
jgi:hypothetical protein